ncbi:MAG: hypothetical protein VCB07_08315 [Gammaproteobacteria bacterium]
MSFVEKLVVYAYLLAEAYGLTDWSRYQNKHSNVDGGLQVNIR